MQSCVMGDYLIDKKMLHTFSYKIFCHNTADKRMIMVIIMFWVICG